MGYGAEVGRRKDCSPFDLVHLSGSLIAPHEVEVAAGGDQVQCAPVQAAQFGHQLFCNVTAYTDAGQPGLETVV